jgi:ACS family hexuronate transporter-like MFS transporter
MLMQIGTGYIVQFTHSYVPLFIVGGCAYLSALAVLQALSPRLAPADLE